MSGKLKLHIIPRFIVILIAIACSLGFKSPKNDGRLVVQVVPVFNGQPLVLNDQYYITANGDSIYIEEFKFYISAIQLQSEHLYAEPNSYHLIDAEDTTSLTWTMNIPAESYQGINLCIGIDSATNVSGALGGALDPTNGMYWAWNTGYINAKLTGHSNKCPTLHHAFGYHIGGYMPPFNALRKVLVPSTSIVILPGQITTVIITADIAKWFKNMATIDVAKTNNVVIPGKEAMTVADNYANMLSVNQVVNPQP